MDMCPQPFCMKTEEWNRIKMWITGREPETEKFAQEQAERLKKMTEDSKEMTRAWPNSLENVTKRNLEVRALREKRSEDNNRQFYEDYCRKRLEKEKRLRQVAEDKAFFDSDAPKMMLSAVIEAEILRERAVQLKFDSEHKDNVAQLDKEHAEYIKNDAICFVNEQKEIVKKIREAKCKNQKDIHEQIFENKTREDKELKTKLEEERIKNEINQKEIEEDKHKKIKKKEADKSRVFGDMLWSLGQAEKRRKEEEERDKLEEKLQNLCEQRKNIWLKARREAENNAKMEKLRTLELIKQHLKSQADDREQKEAEILRAGQEKQLREEIARYEAEKKHQANLVQERKQSRKDYLDNMTKKQHETETKKAWEMLNRYKNTELNQEYMEKLKMDKSKQTEKFRSEIIAQWQERLEKEALEKFETRKYYGEDAENALRRADMRVLKHGEELLEEGKRIGRPEFPIKKVIEKYKGLRRLYPMPDLKGQLKESFPDYAAEDKTDFKNMPMYKPGPRDGFKIKEILQDPKHLPSGTGLCPCVEEVSKKKDGLRNGKKFTPPRELVQSQQKESGIMPKIICKQIDKTKVLEL